MEALAGRRKNLVIALLSKQGRIIKVWGGSMTGRLPGMHINDVVSPRAAKNILHLIDRLIYVRKSATFIHRLHLNLKHPRRLIRLHPVSDNLIISHIFKF